MGLSHPFFPNLIPVKIKLLREEGRLDTSAIPIVVIDSDFREPKGKKLFGTLTGGTGAEKTYNAQVSYRQTEMQEARDLGDQQLTDGHLVFKNADLRNITDQDEVPRKGDIITGIFDRHDQSFRSVDYKIIHVMAKGHLQGESIITFMFFIQNTQETPEL